MLESPVFRRGEYVKRIALFLLVAMFVSGAAYADMNPVREFKERTPVEYNGNPFGLVYAG